ncbi:MAG: electron transport complex subunit RsxC [Ruminococcaceae bacterium]|nr:electron transport complex subunit RsxC [Oscillospiraceae bacterium]
MLFSLNGVHVPHRKNTAEMSALKMDSPKTVTIPMSMHIGKPSVPCVKAGDKVFVGTKIGTQDGFVSSNVHSSVSGTVTKITDILVVGGHNVPAVVIESDGENTPDPEIKAPQINNREDFVNALKESGIVGLGGAGFPTYVKYSTDKPIEYLIINGAECEPYITSDSITMVEKSENIALAIKALMKFFDIKNVIIGIEKNKPKAISVMKKLAQDIDGVTVKVLKSMYPQGGEKVLVYHTTGRTIMEGKLPIDVGCVVSNSTTIAEIGAFLKTGIPLTHKCVTVDGSAIASPKNVIVPIGTALSEVFEFAGGFKEEPHKVLYGGPMMGISVPSLDLPVIKNTNAILAFNKKDSLYPKSTACISCGSCANHCPFGINPPLAAKALRNKDMEALEKTGITLCMECGCCSYVCPAKLPIVQNNKLAKLELLEFQKTNKEGNK